MLNFNDKNREKNTFVVVHHGFNQLNHTHTSGNKCGSQIRCKNAGLLKIAARPDLLIPGRQFMIAIIDDLFWGHNSLELVQEKYISTERVRAVWATTNAICLGLSLNLPTSVAESRSQGKYASDTLSVYA